MSAQPAVVFGGASPEHDISILTGLQAVRALVEGDRDPLAIYWSRAGEWHLVSPSCEPADFADGVPRRAAPLSFVTEPGGGFARSGLRRSALDVSVAVNCCHGGPGEDGTLCGLFDVAGVRYTGPSFWGATLGMDKLAFTATAAAVGLPTLPTGHIARDGSPPAANVDTALGEAGLGETGLGDAASGPLIVKPRFGGSSIGIEIVDDFATARALVGAAPAFADGAVVQPYLANAIDLNISVRTWPQVELSAVERPLRPQSDAGAAIYSYNDKYLAGPQGMASAPRELPAQIPDDITAAIRDAARRIVEPAMLRSVARVDFLCDLAAGVDGLWINEVNTIPGSLSWYLWSERGLTFSELLADLIDEAERGPQRTFSTAGADGTALASVDSIAAKLA